MAAKRRFDRSGVKLSQDAADRRVGRRFPPLQAEHVAQPSEVNIDEAVDRPIGIGASDDRQDREQHDVRQPIQLALGPPRVFDLGQQGDKGSERRHGNPSAAVEVASQGVRLDPRRRNPLCRHPTAVCISVWHFGFTPSKLPKKRALNSPGGRPDIIAG